MVTTAGAVGGGVKEGERTAAYRCFPLATHRLHGKRGSTRRASRAFSNFPRKGAPHHTPPTTFGTPPYEKRKDPLCNGRPVCMPLRIGAGIFEMPHRVLCQRVCVCLMVGSGTQGQGHGQRGHGHRDKDTIDRDTLDKPGDGDSARQRAARPQLRCSMLLRPFGHIAGVPVSRCPSCPCCPHHGQIKIEIGRPTFK